jgi:LysM repeat protein
MRHQWIGAVATLLSAALIGCEGFTGPHPTGTGPFDSRGNYVEAWADNPSKWNHRPTTPEPEPEPEPPALAANTSPIRNAPPRPAATPKPAPKPRPKPKPKFKYHTVRSGDTLYGLAKRYGTTVGKIRSANGISGSLIRVGQKLKIPR